MVVGVGKASDLGQVRHTKNLMAAGQIVQTPSDGFRHAPTDPTVDLIEYQRAGDDGSLRGKRRKKARLESQGDP